MTMKETITVVKTIEIQHASKMRFLPGDQRFMLWYGLVGKHLTISASVGPYVQSVRTVDGREWLLKSPVPRSEVDKVVDDANITYEAGEDWFRRTPNPWCPKGLEKAWIECALRRAGCMK